MCAHQYHLRETVDAFPYQMRHAVYMMDMLHVGVRKTPISVLCSRFSCHSLNSELAPGSICAGNSQTRKCAGRDGRIFELLGDGRNTVNLDDTIFRAKLIGIEKYGAMGR